MERLIEQLISQGYLKTLVIINAFRKIKREDFVVDNLKSESSINAPLPIGQGQTISQPLTVAFMFEQLQPQKGQKILDIGSGSGWTTALLAEIVAETGKVYGIERITELKEFGERNVKKYGFKNVEFFCLDGHKGLPQEAPFDRILVSAAASSVPKALKDQLKIHGRLVIPTNNNDIRLIIKKDKNNFEEKIFKGFVFVPLIKD